MKIFVAGATGAIGRPLVRELHARGHRVVALSRDAASDARIEAAGAIPARGDLFDASSLAGAMAGCDAVVRVATRIPAGGRAAAAWAENDRIRRDGTKALLEAAARAKVPHYLQESVVWLARPDDGAPFQEESPPRPDRITQSALDAEHQAAEAPFRTTTLRLGWLYGADTVHTKAFAGMLRARRLPVIGNGSARLSFLHVDDAARAFADAIEQGAGGLFHVVDDRPTAVGEFFDEMAAAVGAPRPRRVPRWLGALGAGSMVAKLLTTPMLTSHEAFTKATGWVPSKPTPHEGLRELRTRELPSPAPR